MQSYEVRDVIHPLKLSFLFTIPTVYCDLSQRSTATPTIHPIAGDLRFLYIAENFINTEHRTSRHTHEQIFKSFFGVSLSVTMALWASLLGQKGNYSVQHLLWALYKLWHYQTDTASTFQAGVSRKTYAKCTCILRNVLSKIDGVSEYFRCSVSRTSHASILLSFQHGLDIPFVTVKVDEF